LLALCRRPLFAHFATWGAIGAVGYDVYRVVEQTESLSPLGIGMYVAAGAGLATLVLTAMPGRWKASSGR
jgi:hypothetical protein